MPKQNPPKGTATNGQLPVPGGENLLLGSRGSRVAGLLKQASGSQGSRVVKPSTPSIAAEIKAFIGRYIVMSEPQRVVVTAWVLTAWLVVAGKFDRFGHLTATSAEKRSGKTHFLQLLEQIVPNPQSTSGITPAALKRTIKKACSYITIIWDEAQSVATGAEGNMELRAILNGGIDRESCVKCCGGDNHEVESFPIFCPKIMALIGSLDAIIADKSLNIRLKRKSQNDQVERFFLRDVKPEGEALRLRIEEWATQNADRVAEAFFDVAPLPIQNDRMAELFMPLQAVLQFADASLLPLLERFAFEAEAAEQEQESDGLRLLRACREIFGDDRQFVSTEDLRRELDEREEEPWHRFSHRSLITAEALANLLREYEVFPDREQKKVQGKNKTTRGYYRKDFEDAWNRFVPT